MKRQPATGRYMYLNGTNPHIGNTALRHAFNVESGMAAAVTALYSGGLYLYTANPDVPGVTALCVLFGHALARRTAHQVQKITHKARFGSKADKLCIDKRPDAFTPPTKPEHIAAAATIAYIARRKAMMLGLVSGAMAVYVTQYWRHINEPAEQVIMSGLVAFALTEGLSFTLSEARRAHRFNQVARGAWAIRDEPPPKPVTQKIRLPALGALGQPG